jgi:hypothetical protein
MTHYYAMLDERARAAIENPTNWRAIELLAKELMRRRTIKGKELRECIRLALLEGGDYTWKLRSVTSSPDAQKPRRP